MASPAIPVSERPAAPPPERALTGSVALVAGATFFFFLVHTANLPTFPLYVKARGGSDTDIAFFIGLMGVVSIVTRPVTGWLIDSWGRRNMIAAGIGIFSVASFAYGFAVWLPLLGFLRAIQGTAVGIVHASSGAYVADSAPSTRRAEALGYVTAVQTAASTLGPPIGFALLTASFLQPLSHLAVWWPDLAAGPLSGENFAVLYSAMLVGGILGVGFAMFAPDTFKRRTTGAPGPSLRSLIDPRTLLPLGLVTTLTIPFAAILSYLPFYGPQRGLDNAGLYFTVQAVGILAAGLVLGRIADRSGRGPVTIGSMAIAAVSLFMLAAATSAPLILVAAFLSGLGQGGARNALAALAVDRVTPAERGIALSNVSMGFDVGVSIGGPVLGLVAASYGFPAAFAVGGIVIVAGTIAGALFMPRGKNAPPAHAG